MTIIQAVNYYADYYGIESELIHAIIQHESSYNSNAVRFEPEINDKSIGLMQILISTGRSLGLVGTDAEIEKQLFIPEINIKYGTKYLHELSKKYNNIRDIIASYNAGKPRYKLDGTYINQKYVDKVLRTYTLLSSINDINKIMPFAFLGLAINYIAKDFEKNKK